MSGESAQDTKSGEEVEDLSSILPDTSFDREEDNNGYWERIARFHVTTHGESVQSLVGKIPGARLVGAREDIGAGGEVSILGFVAFNDVDILEYQVSNNVSMKYLAPYEAEFFRSIDNQIEETKAVVAVMNKNLDTLLPRDLKDLEDYNRQLLEMEGMIPEDAIPRRIGDLEATIGEYGMTKTLQTVLSGYTSRDPTFCDPYRKHSLVVAGDRILHKLESHEEQVPDEILAAAGTEHVWVEQSLGDFREEFAIIMNQIRPNRKTFNMSE